MKNPKRKINTRRRDKCKCSHPIEVDEFVPWSAKYKIIKTTCKNCGRLIRWVSGGNRYYYMRVKGD